MCSLLWALVNKAQMSFLVMHVLFSFTCLDIFPVLYQEQGIALEPVKKVFQEKQNRDNIKTVIFDPHQKSTCICIRPHDLCVEKAGGVLGAKYRLISRVEQNHRLPACQNLDLSHGGGGGGRKLHLPMEPKENIPCPTQSICKPPFPASVSHAGDAVSRWGLNFPGRKENQILQDPIWVVSPVFA